MTTPLRAFLTIRSSGGEWSTQVFRYLEEIVRAWEQRPAFVTGIVHVGFDRPLAHQFDEVAIRFQDRILLTAAARYALPTGYKASTSPVDEVAGMPIFLAISGWGYEAPDVHVFAAKSPIIKFDGWIEEYTAISPAVVQDLANADIYDDASYLAYENLLDINLRKDIGQFRLNTLVTNISDPCDIARNAPPWLRAAQFSDLDLTVRLHNVFKNSRVTKVSDLDGFTLNTLLYLQNFGRQSVVDLTTILLNALKAGPLNQISGTSRQVPAAVASKQSSLLEEMQDALTVARPREQDIIARRMGFLRPRETLAEIGDSYGITRERIRQIEAKNITKFFNRGIWHPRLLEKLDEMLKSREFPLPLLGIEGADPWFTRAAELANPIQYTLENSASGSIRLIEIDGIQYFAHLTQVQWDTAILESRNLLAAGIDQHWTIDHCHYLVSAQLPHDAAEFSDMLWEKAASLCQFSADSSGTRILVAFGRGAEHVVEALLQESNKPLHFSEIWRRANIRGDREIDERRAHNAAANVGILLGRGIYGLEKHVLLTQPQIELLADEAEEIIATEPPDRQWHAEEILADLVERNSSIAKAIDKYVLNFALTKAPDLQPLGRMVWKQRTDHDYEIARIDIHQAVVTILQQAAGPLSTSEIRKRLTAIRGTNKLLQLVPTPPILRVGSALWGLNDRDVVIKLADQQKLLDLLVTGLEKRGVGLHITELRSRLPSVSGLTAEMVFCLSTLDPRLNVSVGQYLYLTKWGEPRRDSIRQAVLKILIASDQALSLDEIAQKVDERLARACDRRVISTVLQNIGAAQADDGRWIFTEDEHASNELETQ